MRDQPRQLGEHCFTDGTTRPVIEDADGRQHVEDDGARAWRWRPFQREQAPSSPLPARSTNVSLTRPGKRLSGRLRPVPALVNRGECVEVSKQWECDDS
jgi:hypothetical protein